MVVRGEQKRCTGLRKLEIGRVTANTWPGCHPPFGAARGKPIYDSRMTRSGQGVDRRTSGRSGFARRINVVNLHSAPSALSKSRFQSTAVVNSNMAIQLTLQIQETVTLWQRK